MSKYTAEVAKNWSADDCTVSGRDRWDISGPGVSNYLICPPTECAAGKKWLLIDIITMLDAAYDAGRADALSEARRALGIR